MLNIAELWGSPWETLCLHYSELLRNIMLSNCVFRISKSYERPCALTIVCGTKDEPRRSIPNHPSLLSAHAGISLSLYIYIYVYTGPGQAQALTSIGIGRDGGRVVI